MYEFNYGYFCCEPGMVAVIPLSGYGAYFPRDSVNLLEIPILTGELPQAVYVYNPTRRYPKASSHQQYDSKPPVELHLLITYRQAKSVQSQRQSKSRYRPPHLRFCRDQLLLQIFKKQV